MYLRIEQDVVWIGSIIPVLAVNRLDDVPDSQTVDLCQVRTEDIALTILPRSVLRMQFAVVHMCYFYL